MKDPRRREFIERFRAMSEIRRHFFHLEDTWEDSKEAKQGLKKNGINTGSRLYLNIALFLPAACVPFGILDDDRGLLISWSILALSLAVIVYPLGISGRYTALVLFIANGFVAWIYLKFKEARAARRI